MRRLAVNAALRTLLQGAVVTAVAAGWTAARAAATGSGSIPWAHVGTVAIQAAAMAVLAYLGRSIAQHTAVQVPVDVDAWVRAGRTLVVGLVATVGTATWEAVSDAVGAGTYNPAAITQTVAVAAGMAVTAWFHRLLLDGLPVPSAVPPAASTPTTLATAPPLGPGAPATGHVQVLGGDDPDQQ